MTVDQVTPAMINEWFGARHEAASSRVSNLGRLSALFTWAVRQGYATENPCAHIDKPTIESQAPIILTVRQAARLVALCFRHKPQALAWVVVGMFAGLRPEEADKLKWDDVDLDHGLIRLDAASSKVRQRRIIHLETNCQEWLKVSKAIGSALPFPKPTRRRYVRALREAMGWEEWPQDVLRHSAASYLLAKHQDAGRVASELGNSPGILLRHYKELVYKTDAERYWAIRPKARHQKEAGASLK